MGSRLFQTDGPPTLLDLLGGTAFFVGIGVLVTWVLLKPISRDMASPSWPATSALVLASTVERCVDGAGASHFLNYRYAAQGHSYLGFGEDPRRACGNEADMRAQAARYTAGQTIEIRFDPENPSVSTVRTATLSTRARATRIGVWLLFMGMLVAAWFRFRAGEH